MWLGKHPCKLSRRLLFMKRRRSLQLWLLFTWRWRPICNELILSNPTRCTVPSWSIWEIDWEIQAKWYMISHLMIFTWQDIRQTASWRMGRKLIMIHAPDYPRTILTEKIILKPRPKWQKIIMLTCSDDDGIRLLSLLDAVNDICSLGNTFQWGSLIVGHALPREC